MPVASDVKSTHILYLSKSKNNVIYKYSAPSKSPEFKMYLSKSMKVLASKCIQSTKSKSKKMFENSRLTSSQRVASRML